MNAGQIILDQLGGAGRLSAMIGANSIGYGEKHLTFQFKGIRQMNMIRVELNGSDLYDITYLKFNKRTFEIKEVDALNDVFASDLKSSIERTTGLALSL